MITCPFRDCKVKAPDLELLLNHIRTDHHAVAWTMGTLAAALREED